MKNAYYILKSFSFSFFTIRFNLVIFLKYPYLEFYFYVEERPIAVIYSHSNFIRISSKIIKSMCLRLKLSKHIFIKLFKQALKNMLYS